MAAPSLDELLYAYYSAQVPASTQAMYTGGSGTVPVGTSTPPVYSSSVQVSGFVTAPGVTTQIVATGALTGMYEITVNTNFVGAAVAADANNMIFRTGVTDRFRCLIPGITQGQGQPFTFRYRFAAETASVRSILAGTAAVDYWAVIVASRIGD